MVLIQKLNARNIELLQDTKGEAVGVLNRRTGEYKYRQWLGFVSKDAAGSMGKPVRLLISRYGDFSVNTQWIDIPEGKHVQGCLTAHGVYAVEPIKVVPGLS